MATLYVMVGIPGSGKSTFANKCNCPVVSTDAIREELFGSASIQTGGDQVFKEAYKMIDTLAIPNAMHVGDIDVIFDAMNIKRRDRKTLIKKYRDYFDKIVAIYMDTPLEVCLERNAKRDRVVPEKVIRDKFLKISEPKEYEGFDEIIKIKEE